MAATQATTRGLTTDDLVRIRETLAAGRKPRVTFTDAAGQIAGQFGQVVRLTDPAASDEWVIVRFGQDELPFSPTDLAVPARGTKATPRTVPGPRDTAPLPPAPNGKIRSSDGNEEGEAVARGQRSTANKPAPVEAAPAVATQPGAKVQPGYKVQPDERAQPGDKVQPTDRAAQPAQPQPDQSADKARPTRKPAKVKAPPSLTVTLTYTDGEWMVGATQGTRALAKPYLIKPGEALKMISMLDVPGVHQAVDDIVSAARAEAERQAERLRAELAEVESRLADLRDA
jgi:hypothetical protein